jgi:hypothetical protein
LLSGEVQPDPLQLALERDLEHFITVDYDNMVDGGCVGALENYFSAAHLDDLLRTAFDNLKFAQQAMKQVDYTAAELAASRIALASAEIAFFVATAPASESLMAAEMVKLTSLIATGGKAGQQYAAAKALLEALMTATKNVAQGLGLLVTYNPAKGFSPSDKASFVLNALSTFKLAVDNYFASSAVKSALGRFDVGVIRRLASVGKLAYDLYKDYDQWQNDHNATTVAFTTAWFQYATLLRELQQGVVGMQQAVNACKPISQAAPGAIPNGGLTQSRCGPMSGPHTVDVGRDITFAAGPPVPDACYGSASWTWPGMNDSPSMMGLDLKSPCKEGAGSCTYVGAAATGGYVVGCINGSSGFGGWMSCDYYEVLPVDASVIDGHVTDLDGSPVGGIAVRASGVGGTHASAMTASGSDGYFALVVPAGSYAVDPIGTGNIAPDSASATVGPGDAAHANFVQQTGTDLELTLDRTTVDADGLSVLNGTITTKVFGSYGSSVGITDPNTQVQLTGMPGQSAADAVVSGPLATVCPPGASPVWPTGTISAPIGSPVNVTTGTTGTYSFSVTVGTKPGTWDLNAWALNGNDQPALDKDHAAKTVSVTLTPLGTASVSSSSFASALRDVVLTGGGSVVTGNLTNPAQLTTTLAGLAAKKGEDESHFGGLAFAAINGKDGQAMLVYAADNPPQIDPKTGEVLFSAKDANDLVWSPNEWNADNKVPQRDGSLAGAVADDTYNLEIPTFAQWRSGTKVSGWVPVKGNVASIASGNFQWFGWAYPGTTATGACY